MVGGDEMKSEWSEISSFSFLKKKLSYDATVKDVPWVCYDSKLTLVLHISLQPKYGTCRNFSHSFDYNFIVMQKTACTWCS